jgi:uncharacterized RDD family membrane protein YckC
VPGAELNGARPRSRTGASSGAGKTPGTGPDTEGYPGRDFGLPETGPGSVASPLHRAGQFLLDLVVGGLVASAISFPASNYLSLAVWAVLVTVPVAIFGQTTAMVLTGLRVVRVDGAARVGGWALARTVSLFFIVPALIMDRDGRGLHDRVSRTVVVRIR